MVEGWWWWWLLEREFNCSGVRWNGMEGLRDVWTEDSFGRRTLNFTTQKYPEIYMRYYDSGEEDLFAFLKDFLLFPSSSGSNWRSEPPRGKSREREKKWEKCWNGLDQFHSFRFFTPSLPLSPGFFFTTFCWFYRLHITSIIYNFFAFGSFEMCC